MSPSDRSTLPGRRVRAAIVAAALAVLLAVCTGPEPVDPSPVATATPRLSPSPTGVSEVRVAFVEDLASEFDQGRILPAEQGASLGFSNATLVSGLPVSVELVPFDTGGDPTTVVEVVHDIVSDPTYVAAIVAPYLGDQASIVRPLDAAGVPILSLSSRQPGLANLGLTSWRRLVAPQSDQTAALASILAGLRASRRGVCLFHGQQGGELRVSNALERTLPGPPLLSGAAPLSDPPGSAVARVVSQGCGVVVWIAPAEAGAAFRLAMVADGARSVVLVGDDELKAEPFLALAGPAADRTIATCPCVDLSTSTALADQRFIQDYQAEFGSPPAAYSAEAWDAARMLVAAFRAGAVTRSQVLASLLAMPSFDGLANHYAWSADGELTPSAAQVHVYRVEGARWIERALPDAWRAP